MLIFRNSQLSIEQTWFDGYASFLYKTALNGADSFLVFSSKESFFVIAVGHVPLALSSRVTGNMAWMLSSSTCAAGTVFAVVLFFCFLWRPLFFGFFVLTNENTRVRHICYTDI